jgi:quinolinate synthase
MAERLEEQIVRLKRERRAVILAHNYQVPEVQDVADYTGDSLELSRKAAATDAEVIVFCGVHFMAETAKVLSPGKVVLLPDVRSGCPMADMITAQQLEEEKAKYPGVQVVCYVNSSATVKASSDICCTSANAVQVVSSLDRNRPILFVPDQYLGTHAMRKSGRELILWPGYCPVHMTITVDDVNRQRALYPEARVLVHPECRPEVIDAADEALSTSGMLRYAEGYRGKTLIIGTETGILHPLRKRNPAVAYVAASERSICPDMKQITLPKVLRSLQDLKPQIDLPKNICERALKAVERMLAV